MAEFSHRRRGGLAIPPQICYAEKNTGGAADDAGLDTGGHGLFAGCHGLLRLLSGLGPAHRPYLPKQAHVCDAGCGLGGLSVALLPYCRHVTAVDRAAAPLENLRQRAGHDPCLTVRQGDIRCLPPETPYDAMVFCLFGDVEEALTVARQQCRGTVLLIRRDYAYHRFSTGRVPVGFTAADSEDTLRHLGLSYRMERFSLEFGQPLRSLEDARRFFRLYDRSGAGEPPLHRLVPGPGPEFPYYLPNRKELCLLAVEIPAMEEA